MKRMSMLVPGFVILVPVMAHAQFPGDMGPDLNNPPQGMVDACRYRAENASCNMSTPRGQMSGKCLPKNEKLICVPEMLKGQFTAAAPVESG